MTKILKDSGHFTNFANGSIKLSMSSKITKKQNDNKEIEKGKCQQCGKEITEPNFHKFCSDECRDEYYKEEK